MSSTKDFNITNFLLGHSYPYLNQVNITDEFSTLLNVGQPSYRNRTMNATTPIFIVMTNICLEMENQWKNNIANLFPMRPILLNSNDNTTVIVLTIHPQ